MNQKQARALELPTSLVACSACDFLRSGRKTVGLGGAICLAKHGGAQLEGLADVWMVEAERLLLDLLRLNKKCVRFGIVRLMRIDYRQLIEGRGVRSRFFARVLADR